MNLATSVRNLNLCSPLWRGGSPVGWEAFTTVQCAGGIVEGTASALAASFEQTLLCNGELSFSEALCFLHVCFVDRQVEEQSVAGHV